jgi:hypothetical protein
MISQRKRVHPVGRRRQCLGKVLPLLKDRFHILYDEISQAHVLLRMMQSLNVNRSRVGMLASFDTVAMPIVRFETIYWPVDLTGSFPRNGAFPHLGLLSAPDGTACSQRPERCWIALLTLKTK